MSLWLRFGCLLVERSSPDFVLVKEGGKVCWCTDIWLGKVQGFFSRQVISSWDDRVYALRVNKYYAR